MEMVEKLCFGTAKNGKEILSDKKLIPDILNFYFYKDLTPKTIENLVKLFSEKHLKTFLETI